MKLTISIVTLAFACNFIWLVICVDSSKKHSNLVKKSFNATNETISNSNSTLDLKNSTLLSENDDKNNTKLKIDKGEKLSEQSQGNKQIKRPLNESANKITDNKMNTTLFGGKDNKNATIPLMNDGSEKNSTIVESVKSKGNQTIQQPNSKRPNEETTIRPNVKPSLVTPPNSTVEKTKKDQPNLTRPNEAKKSPSDDKIKTTTPRVKPAAELPKNQHPVNSTILGNQTFALPIPGPTPNRLNLAPSNDSRKTLNEKATMVGPKQEIFKTTTAKPPAFQNPISKLPIGMINDKMKPASESVKPKNNSADTDAAIDNAWKIVKEPKYDNLDKKLLPKYEIPAKDLQEFEGEIPINGSFPTNGSATVQPVLLRDAIAKEVMDKEKSKKDAESQNEQAESENEMSKWKIVALILLPLFLITIGIMLFIGIRQRMNVAKGRSVIYELTADLGKKNDEKPVIST